jgi:hypothetical protein
LHYALTHSRRSNGGGCPLARFACYHLPGKSNTRTSSNKTAIYTGSNAPAERDVIRRPICGASCYSVLTAKCPPIQRNGYFLVRSKIANAAHCERHRHALPYHSVLKLKLLLELVELRREQLHL